MAAFALPVAVALAGIGLLIMAVTCVFNGSAPGQASFVQGEVDGDRYYITSKFSARVANEDAREGQAVHQGDAILTLDGGEMLERVSQARAGLSQARQSEAAARAALDEGRNGARREDIEAAHASVRSLEAQYREVQTIAKDLSLKSPVEGEVDKIIVKSGELAASGYPPCHGHKLEVAVVERDAARGSAARHQGGARGSWGASPPSRMTIRHSRSTTSSLLAAMPPGAPPTTQAPTISGPSR